MIAPTALHLASIFIILYLYGREFHPPPRKWHSLASCFCWSLERESLLETAGEFALVCPNFERMSFEKG